MDFSRRGLFKRAAGAAAFVAASPILANLPVPLSRPILRGATAICTVLNGAITAIQITSTGSGYTTLPTITFHDDKRISIGGPDGKA